MQKLHVVIGGTVKDPRRIEFVDTDALDVVGVFGNYASAEAAWRAKAQQTVDNADMRYVVFHLHKLIEPDVPAAHGDKA